MMWRGARNATPSSTRFVDTIIEGEGVLSAIACTSGPADSCDLRCTARWRCSLCGTRNSMAGASGDEERYAARSMSELKLPELVYPVLEFELNRVEVPRVPVAVR